MRLVQAFYKMLFVDRFFHADPHPGNFLVEPLGEGRFRLVVLDFGAVCEAKDELVDGMIEIVQGYFMADDAAVLGGFRRMGFVAEGGNEALLERTVKTYFGKLLKLGDRTPAALLDRRPEELEKLVDPEVERNELQELMRSVEYPEDWFYVERACVLMFWLAAQIDPELDTMAVGMPYVMPLFLQKQARRAAEKSEVLAPDTAGAASMNGALRDRDRRGSRRSARAASDERGAAQPVDELRCDHSTFSRRGHAAASRRAARTPSRLRGTRPGSAERMDRARA